MAVKKAKPVTRFVAYGNMTLVLAPARREPVYNAVGTVLDMRLVPSRVLIFNDGVAETTDPDIVSIVQEHPQWGSEFFWHPSSLPKDADKDDIELSKTICNTSLSRIARIKEGVMHAREGGVAREEE